MYCSTWNIKKLNYFCIEERKPFQPIDEIIFSPILGHSQKVAKREIKSLSSCIIRVWPWGTSCCSSTSATSHYSSFQLQAFIRPQCKYAAWGQFTDIETFHQVLVRVEKYFAWFSLFPCSVYSTSLLCDANTDLTFWFQSQTNRNWNYLQLRPPIVWVGWDSEPWDKTPTTLLTTKSSMWGEACKS